MIFFCDSDDASGRSRMERNAMLGKDLKRVLVIVKKLVKVRDISVGEWDFLLKAFFVPYGLGSLFLMCFVSSPATSREMDIPTLILFPVFMSLFILRSFRRYLWRDQWWKSLGRVAVVVFGFWMLSGGGFGYTNFVNALTAPDDVHAAAGRIYRIEPRRRDAPRVFVFDGKSEIPNIPITDEEYTRLNVGDYYVRDGFIKAVRRAGGYSSKSGSNRV